MKKEIVLHSDITETDILCYQGCDKHEGNVHFASLIKMNKKTYNSTTTRREKSEIAQAVFESIQNYRILRREDEDSTSWYVETNKKWIVNEKIKRALRPKAGSAKSAIKKERRSNRQTKAQKPAPKLEPVSATSFELPKTVPSQDFEPLMPIQLQVIVNDTHPFDILNLDNMESFAQSIPNYDLEHMSIISFEEIFEY